MADRKEDVARVPSKVALLWWSSFEYVDVTVGEYMAVLALGTKLRRRGIAFYMIQRESGGLVVPVVEGFSDCECSHNEHEARFYSA